jgi:hypothetical protein
MALVGDRTVGLFVANDGVRQLICFTCFALNSRVRSITVRFRTGSPELPHNIRGRGLLCVLI